jgi:ATP-dependent DNA helicase RecG
MLKLGRFRGTKITGDILDNKQEHLHAFAIVREAMAWLDRTLPLAARFPPGEIFREDRLPVPAEALRETLLNAVMHRDYSDPGSYVAVAVFDDRIEVRSTGKLPRGITAESLSGNHKSVLRNPLIAEAFHRTGAVEIWGRGTNRVIEECERHGIDPPTFEEVGDGLFVTFRAAIGPSVQVADQVTEQVAGQVTGQVTGQVAARVLRFCETPRKAGEIRELIGLRHRETFVRNYLVPLLEKGWLEPTIPEKPRSRLQQYRTTEAGKRILSG